MTTAQFRLDTFEGPLDLLLTLIAKHKMNIYDIEISLLLAQYLEYMEQLEYVDHEYEAEFLEMAARLVYIKTCQLLPHDEEAEVLKKELEGRLIEYSLIKMAAEQLKTGYVGGNIFVRAPMALPVNKTYTREHEPDVLLQAYLGISKKVKETEPVRAKLFEPIVSHKIVSVTSKIIYVLKRLYRSGECDMSGLYDGVVDKSEKVATFLAILELTKSGRIKLNDDNSKIYFNKDSRKQRTPKEKVTDDVTAEEVPAEETQVINEPENTEQLITEEPVEQAAADTEALTDIAANAETIPPAKESVKPEITDVNKRHEERSMPARIRPLMITVPAVIEPESTSFPAIEEGVREEPVNEHQREEDIEIPVQADEVHEQIQDELFCDEQSYTPNYWAKRRYYWGYSPVGSERRMGYWKYG